MQNEQLAKLKQNINSLINETDKTISQAESKTKGLWEQTKNELQQRQQEAEEQLEQVSTAGQTVPEELKQGTQRSIEELEKAYAQARERTKNMMI